jgi:beta propeller repeat protein
MNNKEIFFSIALILLSLIFASPMTSASTTQSVNDQLTINETQVTINKLPQNNPAIYGDRIVWKDERNGNGDIYVYNLSTSRETQITTDKSDQYLPFVYDDRVVWEDERNGNVDIYMYNFSTSKESRITSNKSDQLWASIYGNRIVWVDTRYGNYDIFVYDLSTSKETQITTSKSNKLFPRIYEDRIVWEDYRNGKYDLFMYNLSTSKENRIVANISYSAIASICDDKIVWSDDRNEPGNYDIYLYNLSTSRETRITTNKSDQYLPVVSENRIVWYDLRNGNRDIYMYDLSTSREIQISSAESNQYNPAIYGSRIVWEDDRNGNLDIYMCTLGSNLPVSAFSASPISGNAPLKVSFTDRSTGSPASWNWSFGDKTYSTSKNPAHTFSKAGKYTVSLTVKNTAGSNAVTKSGYIVVNALKTPVAAFSASPRSGNAPLKVQFADKSSNSPAAWKWSFGDGTYSTSRNPSHTYSKAGKYTISLTVKNAAGSNTKTVSRYIAVNKVVKPVTAFSATPASGKLPLKVQFTDKSTSSPTSWKWSFGDGTYSSSRNPSHTYSKAGRYTVYLTAKNSAGSSTKTMSGYITVSK